MKKILPLALIATLALTGSASASESLKQVSKSPTLSNTGATTLASVPSTFVGWSDILQYGIYKRYMTNSGMTKGYKFITTNGNVNLKLQMESSLASAVFQVFDGYGVSPIFQGTTNSNGYIGVVGTLTPSKSYYVQLTPSYYGAYAYYTLGGTF